MDTLMFKWTASNSHILSALAFNQHNIIRLLWNIIQASDVFTQYKHAVLTSNRADGSNTNSTALNQMNMLSSPLLTGIVPLFCSCFAYLLVILSDAEFFADSGQTDWTNPGERDNKDRDRGFPLPINQMNALVEFFVAICYQLYWVGEGPSGSVLSFSYKAQHRVRSRVSSLLVRLRDRQSRRPFTRPDVWLMQLLPVQQLLTELQLDQQQTSPQNLHDTYGSTRTSRALRLFTALPFVVPFSDRLNLLYSRIDADKAFLGDRVSFSAGRGARARVRRSHLLEDGYKYLDILDDQTLKGRVSIEFVGVSGVAEVGLDGGGLFREFVGELIKEAFDENWGLFTVNTQNNVYPNPDALTLLAPAWADTVTDTDTDTVHMNIEYDDGSTSHSQSAADECVNLCLQYYRFLGRMVGKTIYEKLTVEPQFASFFLRVLLNQHNSFDDLPSLDEQLYRSLMKLKSFTDEQLSDLQLTFTVDRPVYSDNQTKMQTIELISNGSSIPVTRANLSHYLHRLSLYKLQLSVSAQCKAFLSGLNSIVPSRWLQSFTAEELRVLISGQESIDMDDWQLHCQYSSGYSGTHEVIRWFWVVVRGWNHHDKQLLLRFVTSCPRAPLNGFQALQPKFCIQRVELTDEQTLPTAATCLNLLRLPRYSSMAQLQNRLLYACRQGVGFGLT